MAEKTTDKEVSQEKLNEFGVCIDCNGGRLDCLCNNLTEIEGKLVCTVCGKVVE
jgi:hypothetical protein